MKANNRKYGQQYPRKTGFDPAQYCRWKLLIPQKNKVLLEVGCGGGIFATNRPKDYDVEIYGIDISEYSVNFCRKLDCYKGVKKADVEKEIPYPSELFDIVYADQVVEHLQNPLSAVLEMKRVLKEGGLLVINVPTPYNPCFYEDYTHVRPYLPRALDTLMMDAGFRESHAFYYPNIRGIYFLPRKLESNRLALIFLKLLTKIYSNKREAVVIVKK